MEEQTVSGLFRSSKSAGDAITELNQIGFSDSVSVMTKGWDGTPMESMEELKDRRTDSIMGAVVGGLMGLVAGISVFFVPGIGTLLIAGPLAVMMTASGALGGGLFGFLVNKAGISEEDARVYGEELDRGAVLVTVAADEEDVRDVRNVLDKYDALKPDKAYEGRAYVKEEVAYGSAASGDY